MITYLDRQAWWKVPQSFEFLEELPAVGHKTACRYVAGFCIAAFQTLIFIV
jgi:endonuclease III